MAIDWSRYIRSGVYDKPGSLSALCNDLAGLMDWPDMLHAGLWALWHILRGAGVRAFFIPANGHAAVADVQREWRRLHIASVVVTMSNRGMWLLVSGRQARWAEYVLERYLEGVPVPSWDERRDQRPARPERRQKTVRKARKRREPHDRP